MSEFWVASDPPKQADIVAWCEAEVEKACLDMAKNIKVWGHMSEANDEFTAYPYVGGDWELEIDDYSVPVAKLIIDAAESHVSWSKHPEKAGIYGADKVMIETALIEVEAAVAKVKAWLKDGPAPNVRD